MSPLTGTLHKVRFQNCQFDERVFPPLIPTKPKHSLEFWTPKTFMLNPDPRTALADSEVQKLLELKALTEKLPDGFNDFSRIIRNPLLGVGQPSLSILPAKHSLTSSPSLVKKSRSSLHVDLFSFADLSLFNPLPCSQVEAPLVLTFVTSLTTPESDPLILEAAKASPDWPQWLEALQHEYASLRKHQVFRPLVTNLATKPVGHKLIFIKKRNVQGQVIRYKVRLVTQGFIQRPGVDYTFTYSPVIDSRTFRYLLGMAVQYSLDTQLLDVVTAYLHSLLYTQLNIKPPPNLMSQSIPTNTPGSFSCLKL